MNAVEFLKVEQLVPSPTNPRRIRDKAKDAELAESIARVGVLQPVLVRRVNGGLELVVGRRRFDAAKAAGLAEIPAMIRELSDLEALEVQVIENAQREDVHPLEEAEAYEQLHGHGRTVDEIAAKVGKSSAYVYARMKLCALGEQARKAFYHGELSPSTALLVARIPESMQKDALEAITPQWQDQPMSFRRAAEIVHEKFMLRLSEAPFSKSDAELVPAAGPCTTCPKRTGNQRELFADVKSADVCTDPVCFRGKRDAWWQRRSAEAKDSGQRVIEGKAAASLYRYGHLEYNAPVVELDARCGDDPKRRTWRQLLGKHAPDVALVRTERGDVHEVVDRKALGPALKAAGHKKLVDKPAPRIDRQGRDTAQQQRDAVRLATAKAALELLVDAAPKLATRGLTWWRFLATALLHEVWHDSRKAACARRDLKPAKQSTHANAYDYEGALAKWIEKASPDECAGLVVELLVRRDMTGSWRSDFGETFVAACEFAKVDVAKLKHQATSEIKARAKKRAAAATKAKRTGKPAPAPDVPTCRECGCDDDHACETDNGGPCSWVEPDLCSACAEAA